MLSKNVLLNWYSSMKNKMRKIPMIFDIENWFRKSNFGIFWHLPIIPIPKFNNFLWVCWFLDKNLSNFVSPVWKLHNPYCHILGSGTSYGTLYKASFASIFVWVCSQTKLIQMKSCTKLRTRLQLLERLSKDLISS